MNFVQSVHNKNTKMYANAVYIFCKCDSCYFAISLALIPIYCTHKLTDCTTDISQHRITNFSSHHVKYSLHQQMF